MTHYGHPMKARLSVKKDNISIFQTMGVDVVTLANNHTYDRSNHGLIRTQKVLTEKGLYFSSELGKNWENVYLALLTPLGKGKKVMFPIPTIGKADVEFLKQLVEQKHFKPVFDRSYTLEQIVEAYKYVETGQKTGNVVLTLP